MSIESAYKDLCNGGGFSIHHLIKLSNIDDTQSVYLCDNNEALVYDGITYLASNFTYNVSFDGSATLQIELVKGGNAIINIIEDNHNLKLDVKRLLIKQNSTQLLSNFYHYYGKASWDSSQATFNFDKDDRLNMTFPCLIWDKYSNKGNS